jgi:hypothetical protein
MTRTLVGAAEPPERQPVVVAVSGAVTWPGNVGTGASSTATTAGWVRIDRKR